MNEPTRGGQGSAAVESLCRCSLWTRSVPRLNWLAVLASIPPVLCPPPRPRLEGALAVALRLARPVLLGLILPPDARLPRARLVCSGGGARARVRASRWALGGVASTELRAEDAPSPPGARSAAAAATAGPATHCSGSRRPAASVCASTGAAAAGTRRQWLQAAAARLQGGRQRRWRQLARPPFRPRQTHLPVPPPPRPAAARPGVVPGRRRGGQRALAGERQQQRGPAPGRLRHTEPAWF